MSAFLMSFLGAQEREKIQTINAKILSIDLQNNQFSVKEYSTGHTLMIHIGKDLKIAVLQQLDYDDLPKLQWLRNYGARDETNKIIKNGDLYIGDYSKVSPLTQEKITYGQLDWDDGDFKDKLQWVDGGVYRSADGGVYSRDGSKKYKLKVGNDYYHLKYKGTKRPCVFEEQSSQLQSQLKPGKWATITYEVSNGENRARSVRQNNDKEYLPPYWAHFPIGASGQTVDDLSKKFEAVKKGYAENIAGIKNAMPVMMKIVPELANENEPVALVIKVLSSVPPHETISYYSDYLKKGLNESKQIAIQWKKEGLNSDTNKQIYIANVTLPSSVLGQHLIKWSCNVGGDISEYSRSYAIIDNSTAVFTFNNLSVPTMKPEYDTRYLPYNTWEVNLIGALQWTSDRYKMAPNWAAISKSYRQYGISPGFMPQYTGWGMSQIREESAAFQQALLAGMKEIIPYFGFDTENLNFGDYGMGKETVEIARALGYKYVHSLCTNNHIDSSFGINHSGKPERPYFISSEDFRKPQREKKAIMGFSQLQWNNPIAIKYFSHYCIGAGEFTTLDTSSIQKANDWETYYSRLDIFLDALYQNTDSQRVPYFIQMNYQFESKHPSVVHSCKRELKFLLDKAKKEKLVFTTNNGIADYYSNHYKTLPETTTYFQDYYSGFSVGDKPANYPDVMQIENEQQMVVSNHGSLLPDKFYDYETTWNYPDCGDFDIPRSRSKWGTIPDEDEIYKFKISPKIVDTRNFLVTELRANDDAEITVTIDSKVAQKNLPISLWDIGREFSKVSENYAVSGNARFIPVRAPFTGNLNGYLIANIVEGINKFTMTIKTPKRESKSVEFKVGDSIKCKAFETNGRKDAYLWNTSLNDANMTINLPRGRTMDLYLSPLCEKKTVNEGSHTFVIPFGERMQITEYTKDELISMIHVKD